jgi:glycine/D-amino acid oxidase-like deaminating enzyme
VEGLNGLYVCCTHSGITLAPALAELGAREILTDETQDMLLPFRPARLMSKR